MPDSAPTPYRWRFFRAGGFDQVKLDSGCDLANLDQLDQKLWVALACPARGIEFDTRTLDLIDTDKDGRIRAPEIIAAARWTTGLLKNPDDLLKGSASLPLSAINDATAEGKQLLSSAREILVSLGKKDAAVITLGETTDTTKFLAQTRFNGDGVIPADAADDDTTRTVINEVIICLGAETDRSGKPGISQAKADLFFSEAQAHADWWKLAETDKTILPLGEATTAAAIALKVVKLKVDDYFTRCRLAAFDARSLGALNREEKEYLAFAGKDLTSASMEIAAFPLARIEAGRPLPLKDGINPAWAGVIAKLQAEAVKPLLGDKPAITELEWFDLVGKLAAYETWSAGKAGATVEKLGLKRLREILAGKTRETIAALIAKDKALEPEFSAISAVDQLVRYHRDLLKLCRNFVNFSDFYGRKDKAVFQVGTLYLDTRSCELCIRVEDMAKHSLMAALAGSYLAYCDCVRKSTGEKMTVAAAFTNGDSDNLMVGRNGIFYDPQGRDWDATIVKIVDNPISFRQAFWSPYKKLVRFIEEHVAKRAATADAAASTRLSQTAEAAANADKSKPAEPKKVDVGTVAALGVAVGSIGTALGYFLRTIAEVEDWQLPLLALLVVLAISGPSMLIAWLKLRKRNLGPILDANGWAVNAKARINVPFGASLTSVAKLPPGARTESVDRFADRGSAWPKVLTVLFFLWWTYAILNSWGLIYQWTEHTWGKPPKNEQKSQDKKEGGSSNSNTPTNTSISTATASSVPVAK